MKKTNKRNIWGTLRNCIISLLFISCWTIFGVALALKTADTNIGGSIKFTATDVYADVTGTVTGSTTENILEDIHFSASTPSNYTTPSSWSNMNLTFDEDGSEILITINVLNKSDERGMTIGFTDNFNLNNVNIIRRVAGQEVDALGDVTLDPSESKTLEISMTVADINYDVKGIFSMRMDMAKELPPEDESAYPTLSFTYDDTTKTASVGKNSSNKPTGNLVIPSKVMHNGEEYTVTGLASFSASGEYILCFNGCAELTSVTLPNGITTIPQWAFANCTSLTTVNLPKNLTSIGLDGFAGCPITSIDFPSTLTSIGGRSFSASKLQSLYIPKSVTSIGDVVGEAMLGGNLTSIIVEEGNENYYSYENGLYRKSDDALIAGGMNTIIKEGTESIINAFRYCDITSINLPSSLTSIKMGGSFVECKYIESITSEEGGTYTAYENGLYQDKELILGCKNTIIKDDTTSIGSNAFSYCAGLTTIDIPESVTGIGYSAFLNCSSLEGINISSNVTSIGTSAFMGCSELTSIIIPEGITSIESNTFKNCTKLQSVSLPDGLLSIYGGAFCGCTSLTTLELPETLTTLDQPNTMMFTSPFDDDAFERMTITSKNSLFYTYGNALYKGTTLLLGSSSTTAIKEGTTEIGKSAFCGTNLVSIIIPESVTKIDWYALLSINTLQSVTFENPNGWTDDYSGESVDFSNPTQNAEYFKNNGGDSVSRSDS